MVYGTKGCCWRPLRIFFPSPLVFSFFRYLSVAACKDGSLHGGIPPSCVASMGVRCCAADLLFWFGRFLDSFFCFSLFDRPSSSNLATTKGKEEAMRQRATAFPNHHASTHTHIYIAERRN
jgi:hypothetical protein